MPNTANPVLLHLSDTHFGTERPEVVQALLNLAAELRPEIAVLSGDVTQRARRGQFDAAARFMDELTAHAKLVLPGNHDLPLFNPWQRCMGPYEHFHRVFGPDLAPTYRSERFLVLGVNTTRAWRHKNGEVSSAQVDGVAQRLLQARHGQLRIVVTHQPMAVVGDADRRNLLRGHAQAARAWTDAGVDLVLGGHIHLAYVCPLHSHGPAVPAAPAPWVVQAGTAVSSRVRQGQPNSVHVIRHESRADGSAGCRCEVRQFDYNERERRFRSVATWQLGFGRG